MTSDRTGLLSQADFEHALSEVEQLLETSPPETAEDRYFGRLLGQIAEYHDAQAPARQNTYLDRLQALAQRLNAFGKRWPHPQDEDAHWSPLLGGELTPTHHTPPERRGQTTTAPRNGLDP